MSRMADVKDDTAAQGGGEEDGGPGEKEVNKADSPKPDQEVAPPLISVGKGEFSCQTCSVLIYGMGMYEWRG